MVGRSPWWVSERQKSLSWKQWTCKARYRSSSAAAKSQKKEEAKERFFLEMEMWEVETYHVSCEYQLSHVCSVVLTWSPGAKEGGGGGGEGALRRVVRLTPRWPQSRNDKSWSCLWPWINHLTHASKNPTLCMCFVSFRHVTVRLNKRFEVIMAINNDSSHDTIEKYSSWCDCVACFLWPAVKTTRYSFI